jgi:hypothetical protein
MPHTVRRVSAPLIAAAVAGALAVVLAVIYFVWVHPDHSAAASTGAFTRTEREVMDAAATEAVNLQTYRRAHFDADWNRALSGTTGALKSDLAKDKARILKAMQQAKIDTKAQIAHTALAGPTDKGNGYVVLVTVLGYKLSGTSESLPATQRLQLTMVNVGGKWLATDLQQLGLI